MIPYDHYLFDADGTLFDTKDLIYSCFQHVAKIHFGTSLNKEAVISKIGMPLKDMLAHYLGPDLDLEAVLEDYMEHQIEILADSVAPFPKVIQTLETLKNKGKRLVIVTSRRRYSMEIILEATDTSQFFDDLVTPENTCLHKPNPEPVLKALSLLQANAQNAVLIGDTHYDICSGNSAGVDTVFVNWSYQSFSSLPVSPTWTINSIAELTAPGVLP